MVCINSQIIFGITQKPLYNTSSNLVRLMSEIFWTYFVTWRVIGQKFKCLLCFIILSFKREWACPLKGTGIQRKKLFQNILFLTEFIACNGCFGLFTKIRKGPGASFMCTFSAWFFHKNVPCLILYQLAKFKLHFFLKISNKTCY